MLRQTLYNGVITFNKMQYRKHPENGKRLSIMRPEKEWRRKQAVTKKRANALFGGKLYCGEHNQKITATYAKHYSCPVKGCPNGRSPAGFRSLPRLSKKALVRFCLSMANGLCLPQVDHSEAGSQE